VRARYNAFTTRRFAGFGLILMGLLPLLSINLPGAVLAGLPLILAGFTLMSAVGRTNLGIVIFSLWLIVLGSMMIIRNYFTLEIPSYDIVMLIVAILAGLLMLVDR